MRLSVWLVIGRFSRRGGLRARAAAAAAPPPDLACYPMGHHFAFLDTDTRIYRQGSQIAHPRVTPRPAEIRSFRCIASASGR